MISYWKYNFRIKFDKGCHYSVDWTTGLEHWTGLLNWHIFGFCTLYGWIYFIIKSRFDVLHLLAYCINPQSNFLYARVVACTFELLAQQCLVIILSSAHYRNSHIPI